MPTEKKNAVHDPVRLEDEGETTSQDVKYRVPGDNNNQNLYKSDVQGKNSS